MKTITIVVGAVVALGLIMAGWIYIYWDKAVPIAAMAINYVRYLSAPAGTLTTEEAVATDATFAPSPGASIAKGAALGADATPGAASDNWPSYNKTLTSNRFSGLKEINKANVSGLKVLCTYDTGQYTGFNSGLLEVNDALIAVTEYDIISLDPTNCRENWRKHEDYTPAAGPRTAACWLMISRPARACGQPRSPIQKRENRPPPRPSPGTVSFSSATRVAT
jgi:alcohol dehydrogenase (cytochrome c)